MKDATLRLLLVVPGTTDLDQQQRIKGSLNVPLNRDGARQVEQTASELNALDISVIYAAPCLAAQQTAEQLSRLGGIKVRNEPKLQNLNRGLWSGKSISEVKKNQPRIYRKWQDNPDSICPPDGESVEQARARVVQLIRKIRKKHKKGVVALVASAPAAGSGSSSRPIQPHKFTRIGVAAKCHRN